MENQIWATEPGETRRTCMLMITHSCNLNCTYCYEKFKSEKKMSFETAKEIILRECEIVKNDDRFDGLEIDFMGGEPMVNFGLMKQIVEWGEALPLPVPHIYFMTTNGTLFTEEAKRWFEKYKDVFWVGTSYDGTPEMQEKNRGQSNKVEMEFFYNLWPKQEFHMTVSKETLPNLAEGVLAIQRKGYSLIASLAEGILWTEDDVKIYYDQLLKLKNAYLEDLTLRPINLLVHQLFINSSDQIKNVEQKKYCGTGTYMQTYDVDGKAYGCHMFTPIVLGERAFTSETVDWECAANTIDPFCKECVLKNICPTCAGFNFNYRNNIAERDKNLCNITLVQMMVAAEFQLEILTASRKVLSDKDAKYVKLLLEAIPVLQQFNPFTTKAPFVSK